MNLSQMFDNRVLIGLLEFDVEIVGRAEMGVGLHAPHSVPVVFNNTRPITLIPNKHV